MLFDLSQFDNPAKHQLSEKTTQKAVEKTCKTWQKLTEAIGTIEPGKDIHFCTAAYWSTHDLVKYIISQIGPAKITACTWSFSQPGVMALVGLHAEGMITDAQFLVDWRIKLKVSDALALLKRTCSKFRISHCHAKVTVLQSATHSVSIVGSANWTNNPRIESGVISTDAKIAEFHRAWIEAEIDNTDPMQKDFDVSSITTPPQETVKAATKNLIIIRGLPGSGKTTLAALFPGATVCENDEYFTKNGVYSFNRMDIGKATANTKAKGVNAMKDAVPTVIVSNTSSRETEFLEYANIAKKLGYQVHTVIAENRNGTQNTHGVPPEKIEEMRARFEVQL